MTFQFKEISFDKEFKNHILIIIIWMRFSNFLLANGDVIQKSLKICIFTTQRSTTYLDWQVDWVLRCTRAT